MREPLALPLPPTSRIRWMGLQILALLAALALTIGAPRAQDSGEADAIDPPGRVGTISLLSGPVVLSDLQTGSREEAALNWPITAGWRVETGRAGRAEVRVGSTALRLDEETTVDFVRLDDRYIQVAVLRGSLALRLRNRDLANELEVLTQRERIVFDDAGRYRIDVDQVPGHTAVTAFTGRARIANGENTFVVAGGQRGEVSVAPMVRFDLSVAVADRFDDWVGARDARDDALRSTQYVSRETTGVELLDEYGRWRSVDDYGPVWFPQTVPQDWAPYRHGRWAWVDPWGWTWVDEAPWGFAPFHYGRWVVVGGSWGWVPGVVVPRPIYAPALVAWFGTSGISVGIGAPIGWFPLGPREVYVPAFRHTPRYLRVVNVQHVPNVERVTIVKTPRYVHRHADRSTWLPGDRFGRPDPVHRSVRPPPSEWRQYIARPEPPANVPNTKRRQQVDPARPLPTARPPSAVNDAPVPVRPPMATPRAIETPATTDAPRDRRGRGELPSIGRDERRPPRAPSVEVRPTTPAAAPAPAPAPQARPRDFRAEPVPTPVPATAPPPHRGRGELGAAASDAQRRSPRVPPPVAAPAPVPPVQQFSLPPRGATRESAPQEQPARSSERRAVPAEDRPTGRSPREALR